MISVIFCFGSSGFALKEININKKGLCNKTEKIILRPMHLQTGEYPQIYAQIVYS
jgi:hypothetical protein